MLRNVCHRSRLALGGTLHVWQNSAKGANSLISYVARGSSASFGDNAKPRFLSSSSSQPCRHGSEDPPSSSHLYPVYVHQVSKTVLQHLQDRQSEWLVANGLDKGLHVNANGTFILKFLSSRPGVDAGRIWYVRSPLACSSRPKDRLTSVNRTSYEAATQQHWLSVYRQKLLARFLLKDASKSPRNTHYRYIVSTKTELEIRVAVDRMIEELGGGGTINL
jgi:hypothetical protein